MKASTKRRHHVVPRFYLRRFADNAGQVIRVELPGLRRHLLSVNNAAVVNDFYLMEGDDTATDAFENALSTLEGRAATAFQTLIDQRQLPLDPQVRAVIAVWAAAQHLRTVAARQAGSELTDAAVKLSIAIGGREALGRALETIEGHPATAAEIDEAWQLMTQFEQYRVENAQVLHLEAIDRRLPSLADAFSQRGWQVVRFSVDALVTTDTPAVLMRGPGDDPRMPVGTATAGGILVPLDRRIALVMTEPGDPDLELAGDAVLARALNQQVVAQARSAVFHHPEDDPLDGLELPQSRAHEVEIRLPAEPEGS